MTITDNLTVAEKQQLLTDLKEAYYSGAKRIRFRERDVTYQSADDMFEAIGRLEDELNAGTVKYRPAVFTTFGRGY